MIETVDKPGWPARFWAELERSPLPEDFDIGEELPDQPERSVGWFDASVSE